MQAQSRHFKTMQGLYATYGTLGHVFVQDLLITKATPTYVSRLLCFAAVLFFFRQEDSTIPGGRETPRQTCTRGLVIGRTREIHLDISPTPPILHGVKSAKFGDDILSTTVIFNAFWFQNGGTHRKSNTSHLQRRRLYYVVTHAVRHPSPFYSGGQLLRNLA